MAKILDRIGDWNPQLFRELKGRFRPRNLAITIGVSIVAQLLLISGYFGALPSYLDQNPYNRYCTGFGDEYWRSTYQCLHNARGDDWLINWRLWELDVFIGLGMIGMILMLVIGSHLISMDLIKEEKRGTLGFVRLSPQAFHRIVIGKILGVPSLVYLGMALALPIHLMIGLHAGIALPWIGMVYAMAIAACIASYSLVTLWSFVGQEFFGGFQAWLYSGALSFYLMIMTIMTFDGNFSSGSPFDWLRVIYPGNIFYYIVDRNPLDIDVINYLYPGEWFDIEWYHSNHWTAGFLGLGVMAAHYICLTMIAWHGIRRRFYDPQATIISKRAAFAVAVLSMFMITGFAAVSDSDYQLINNFQGLQAFYYILFLTLIFCLTPTKQRVQDWVRYRHTKRFATQMVTDLLIGDRSPALLAIAVMLVSCAVMMIAVAANDPFLYDKFPVVNGLILQTLFLFLCACVVQFIYLRSRKRGLMLTISLGALTIGPSLFFLMFEYRFDAALAFGLLSAFPMAATTHNAAGLLVFWCMVGESLTAIAGTVYLHKNIRRLGQSELKTLLASPDNSPKNVLT